MPGEPAAGRRCLAGMLPSTPEAWGLVVLEVWTGTCSAFREQRRSVLEGNRQRLSENHEEARTGALGTRAALGAA